MLGQPPFSLIPSELLMNCHDAMYLGRTTARTGSLCGPWLLLMAMLLGLPTARAALRPLWEVGAGLGGVALPAYRGANDETIYLLPLPYFVYRGKFLRSDREGLRGIFFQGSRIQLNLSANAGPPVESGSITARQGMPNLSPSFEIGPSLQYKLIDRPGIQLDLRCPVRAAFTFSMKAIGWVSSPNIDLTLPNSLGTGWMLGVSLGPEFADRRYDAYFYNVAPVYARPDRPVYSAVGGYSGVSVLLTASRRFDHYWVGAFVRYDNLAGASFINSPLVETQQYLAVGLGMSWIFAASSQLVESGED